MKHFLALLIFILMFSGCTTNPDRVDLTNYHKTAIYYGGDILTMNDEMPVAEAVLIGDGKILAVGKQKEILKNKKRDTKLIDIKGKTMLPGFIDSHSHINQVTKFPDFSPAEGVVSKETLVEYGAQQFNEWFERSQAEGTYEQGDWFIGNGYDNTIFPNAENPTAADLDKISADIPVCIIHMSNHVAVVNSKGLEILGYYTGSQYMAKYNKLLGKYPDGKLNGLLEEEAYFRLYFDPNVIMDNTRTNTPTDENILRNAMHLYASMGITTAQDGAGSNIAESVKKIIAEGDSLLIDINSYGPKENMPGPSRETKYTNGLRIAGVKLFLDGSPQAKTAWLLQPYYVVPDGKSADYNGFPQMTDAALYEELVICMRNGYQVIAHANGSAAIRQFLEQYNKALETTGASQDLMPVIIHSQTITESQLDEAERLGINPSFFHDHTYYWGDYYLSSILGPDLGQHISPLSSALKRNINVTIHQDSPVVPPDMIFSIHNAVNRITRNGQSIGQQYTVDPMDAIKLVTINGAKQYYQENERGSIEPGKIADFVILDKNPVKVDKLHIKDIIVLETIKRGKTIYKKEI
ncbi:MAG: amidohydrolase [Bacteroidales bacterium]|jgi:predicted amidohydrolase YtcJ|nr:amidohydrolase [Bacteroidales bacterium]